MLGLSRSSVYYRKRSVSQEDLELMKLIDEIFTGKPFYGSRRICDELKDKGYMVNRKRIQRLMRLMGLEVLYPKPNTSKPNIQHKKYPYLLRGVTVNHPNQVWATDITYVPMRKGFLYLVAIMDWYSRYIISWKLSNSLDTSFCLDALELALKTGKPEIFNSDQGSQFTSIDFTQALEKHGVQISMDGKGRCLDNIFVERFWRSLKYEEIYLKAYDNGIEARLSIGQWIDFYNHQRRHQSLHKKTPAELFKLNNSATTLIQDNLLSLNNENKLSDISA